MQDFSEKYRENEGSQILNIWREISQCQFLINYLAEIIVLSTAPKHLHIDRISS